MKTGGVLKMKVSKITYFTISIVIIICLLGACQQQPSNTDAQQEDDFPNRPITLVIPFGLGSGDAEARAFARVMEKHIGQTIIPSNHEGGSGALGIGYLLAQPADGYTLSFMSATIAFGMASGNIPYSPEDIQPLGSFNADYIVLAVEKDSPFETFEDMVKYAKDNPGRLNVGGTNVNGAHHVFAISVFNDAEIEAQYVPYNGSNETLVALLGKNIDVMVTSPTTIRQHVEVGDIRILAVSTSERVEEFSDVPTLMELGLKSIDDFLNYRGYFVKPGIPEERLKVLDEAFEKTVNDPEYLEYLAEEKLMKFYKNREEYTKYFNNFTYNAKSVFEELK